MLSFAPKTKLSSLDIEVLDLPKISFSWLICFTNFLSHRSKLLLVTWFLQLTSSLTSIRTSNHTTIPVKRTCHVKKADILNHYMLQNIEIFFQVKFWAMSPPPAQCGRGPVRLKSRQYSRQRSTLNGEAGEEWCRGGIMWCVTGKHYCLSTADNNFD